MIRRGLILVLATTSFAVDNGILIFVFLRDRVLFIWEDTGVRSVVCCFSSYFEKSLFWVRRYVGEVSVRVQYRAFYRDVTVPMKDCYRKLKRKA